MKNGKLVSEAIKIGPLWNRTVFDPEARVVKRRDPTLPIRYRTVCRFEDIQVLRIREYINRDEEEQLLNLHPEVQKAPRDAELWLDLRDGKSVHLTSVDRAGLLLQQAAEIAQQLNVPVQTERRLMAQSEPPSGPRAT